MSILRCQQLILLDADDEEVCYFHFDLTAAAFVVKPVNGVQLALHPHTVGKVLVNGQEKRDIEIALNGNLGNTTTIQDMDFINHNILCARGRFSVGNTPANPNVIVEHKKAADYSGNLDWFYGNKDVVEILVRSSSIGIILISDDDVGNVDVVGNTLYHPYLV